MTLADIFSDLDPDIDLKTQAAWDMLAGRPWSQVHYQVAEQYLRDPSAQIIELALPRQSGKSAWINWIAQQYPGVIRVYPGVQLLRNQPYRDEHQYAISKINAGAYRGKRLTQELVLFDDVYLNERVFDTPEQVLDRMLTNMTFQHTPMIVSLYTPRPRWYRSH